MDRETEGETVRKELEQAEDVRLEGVDCMVNKRTRSYRCICQNLRETETRQKQYGAARVRRRSESSRRKLRRLRNGKP